MFPAFKKMIETLCSNHFFYFWAVFFNVSLFQTCKNEIITR